jgi:hypothetical protein
MDKQSGSSIISIDFGGKTCAFLVHPISGIFSCCHCASIIAVVKIGNRWTIARKQSMQYRKNQSQNRNFYLMHKIYNYISNTD